MRIITSSNIQVSNRQLTLYTIQWKFLNEVLRKEMHLKV